MNSKSTLTGLPPPKWVIELHEPANPNSKPKSTSLPDPPGFTPSTHRKEKALKTAPQSQRKPPTQDELDTLKLKKAWEIAIAPAKQLPMSAIGMYMSGNSLQVFSIMMVFMLFKTPITAMMNIQPTFARLETDGTRDKMLQVKAVFVLCNLLSIALGIWKVNGMGLLPTTRSDWLAWESARVPLERAYPA